MCDRESYMKMTRDTNLMQKLRFIIIEIFMIINHNCCIKLVPLVILCIMTSVNVMGRIYIKDHSFCGLTNAPLLKIVWFYEKRPLG
jgi:hypothetical protein